MLHAGIFQVYHQAHKADPYAVCPLQMENELMRERKIPCGPSLDIGLTDHHCHSCRLTMATSHFGNNMRAFPPNVGHF
eukprot:9995569-Ditylum_brightwellii.AAC.1